MTTAATKTRVWLFSKPSGDGYARALHGALWPAAQKTDADKRTRYVYRDWKEHWRTGFDEPSAEVFWEVHPEYAVWCVHADS